MMIQHEYYDEILNQPYDRRHMEKDAMSPDDQSAALMMKICGTCMIRRSSDTR